MVDAFVNIVRFQKKAVDIQQHEQPLTAPASQNSKVPQFGAICEWKHKVSFAVFVSRKIVQVIIVIGFDRDSSIIFAKILPCKRSQKYPYVVCRDVVYSYFQCLSRQSPTMLSDIHLVENKEYGTHKNSPYCEVPSFR